MQKRIDSSRRKSFGVVYACVLRQFSVFPRIHALILPDKLQKDYKIFSMWLQNKKNKMKYRTHYAIFQNRRICASCQLYGLVHYAACAFCHICTACGLLLWVWPIKLLMQSWAVWALRERECECVWRFFVFVIVDVKYIIHYRRMCKFICAL